MFEPVQLAEVSRISLLSPCVLAVLQYHLSQNDALSGKILHGHRLPVTVARLTVLIGNFVVCCCRVTKLFGAWKMIIGALSARSPCNFVLLQSLHFGSFEKCVNTLCFPDVTFFVEFLDRLTPEIQLLEWLVEAPLSTKLSANSSGHSGRSPNESHRAKLSLPLKSRMLQVSTGCTSALFFGFLFNWSRRRIFFALSPVMMTW